MLLQWLPATTHNSPTTKVKFALLLKNETCIKCKRPRYLQQVEVQSATGHIQGCYFTTSCRSREDDGATRKDTASTTNTTSYSEQPSLLPVGLQLNYLCCRCGAMILLSRLIVGSRPGKDKLFHRDPPSMELWGTVLLLDVPCRQTSLFQSLTVCPGAEIKCSSTSTDSECSCVPV